MAIRLLIVDDHAIVRAGLISLLNGEEGLEVVGETGDGWEALRQINQVCPDVVLLDISLGEISGLDIARSIKALSPHVRVLILSVHEEGQMLRSAIHSGASGYLSKRVNKSELINAIYAVSRNEVYVHSSMVAYLLGEKGKDEQEHAGASSPLTRREIEVLRLLAKGNTNAQVAEMLQICERTVEFHRKNILFKLNLSNRADLVRFASERGYL